MEHYILCVDDKPVQGFGSLDDAKRAGIVRLGQAKSLKIEHPAGTPEAPVPTAIWEYVAEVSDWVRKA